MWLSLICTNERFRVAAEAGGLDAVEDAGEQRDVAVDQVEA